MPSPLESLFNLDAEVDADGRVRLPDAVIRAMRTKPGDKVRFQIRPDGSVTVASMDAEVLRRPSEMASALAGAARLMGVHSSLTSATSSEQEVVMTLGRVLQMARAATGQTEEQPTKKSEPPV